MDELDDLFAALNKAIQNTFTDAIISLNVSTVKFYTNMQYYIDNECDSLISLDKECVWTWKAIVENTYPYKLCSMTQDRN